VYRIQPVQKPYAWGSLDRLQSMFHLGDECGSRELAEMWFSGHRQSPSTVQLPDGSFQEVPTLIRRHPEEMLGENASHLFGPVMPYLFKVISARIPLSLQVHPLDFQARAGFNRENALNIALDAPERSFKDTLAKNEMVVALEPFTAAVGFAPPNVQLRLLASVPHPVAQSMAAILAGNAEALVGLPEAEHRRDILDAMMPLSAITWPESRKRIFRAFATAITAPSESGDGLEAALRGLSERMDPQAYPAIDNALQAARAFPGDPSVLCMLMMNPVRLDEGESVYIPAGTPHAYIHGTAAEIMNNSDNVLRAGMTAKHKDIGNLLHSLNCLPGSPIDPSNTPFGILSTQYLVTYRPHVNEFMLAYGHVDDSSSSWAIVGRLVRRYGELLQRLRPQTLLRQRVQLPRRGPRVLLCTEGAIRCSNAEESVELTQGEAVFIPSSDGRVEIRAAEHHDDGHGSDETGEPHAMSDVGKGSYLLASTPL
jgi:mannose-6-phosphate isomerase